MAITRSDLDDNGLLLGLSPDRFREVSMPLLFDHLNAQCEGTVVVNRPEVDPDTGMSYRSNDILRTRLKVALEDVPSSSSFRAQQLSALSESVKSMPADMQQVVFPFMVDLMDLPRKKDVVEAIRNASGR